jgi:5'-nucleotidase/UDP-sugar diphosphatase
VPELRKQADVVIAVTHMGYYFGERHGTEAPGDGTLARLVPDIDVIVGGHTHTPLYEPARVGRTWIVQAGEWSKWLGRLDLEIDLEKSPASRVLFKKYELLPVNLVREEKPVEGGAPKIIPISEPIPEDPGLLSLLKPFKDRMDKKLSVRIGHAVDTFEGGREFVRHQEMPIAVFFLETMKSALPGADVYMVNGGNIRAGIPAGPLELRTLFKVNPFNNDISRVKVSGAQLKHLIQESLKRLGGSGGYPHFQGVSVCGKEFKIQGVPLDLEKTYTLVAPDFILVGGDAILVG